MDRPLFHPMTPYEQALQVYHREPCRRTFAEDLSLHLLHGFVFSTPEYFVMGRPVKSIAAPELIVNPEFNWDRDQCDAWMIYLFSGDMTKAWERMPWELPLICIERRNELRIYNFSDIARHVA